ncbi:hypothetical protein LCGC14_1136800 [marine sediment metagenome]|uniref:Uncharacterized protein n=1 Tax=marine sediment metagenome TaxID=412755 RepID=A0A0F9MMF9_9ZZZZ
MKIPYNRTRQLSTAELPGVICDPILIFEFVANPSFALVNDISTWLISKIDDWSETRRLAAELIQAIIVPDGTRQRLGTLEEIDSVAEQTDRDFIVNVLNGWHKRISLERIADVKKLRPLLAPLPASDGKSGPRLAS